MLSRISSMTCTGSVRVVVICFVLLGACAWRSAAAEVTCMPASSGMLKDIKVWNPAANNASMFRSDMDKIYFKVWPEDLANPRFQFFCQDSMQPLRLNNFTRSCDERFGRLDPRPYYDVGTANDLQPYYKHWSLSELLPTTDIQIHCERNDMRRLYSHRIWRKTLLPALLTTIVLWIILEFAALLCASAWRLAAHPRTNSGAKTNQVHSWLPDVGWTDTAADCIHLLLLIFAGFCMIEAVSHSSTRSWRSTCMLDAAVLYTYLTFFSLLSSFFRQVAVACRRWTKDHPETDPSPTSNSLQSTNSTSPFVNPGTPNSAQTANPRKKSRELHDDNLGEGKDWKWQRVFNQFAVLILMTSFLSYNENFDGDALDDLASVIWSVIMVAATWSIGVSMVIGCRSVILMMTLVANRWPRHSLRGRNTTRGKPPAGNGIAMHHLSNRAP